ncbi:stage IV sporulation protein FB [Oceanobacillus piezotolerans]|uniref:Stage IV sporulation protein FB n=1 Tax=Oceanobacillus piezotolerans TaxID=2448030 RepID=A0A498DD49_9BACI|nr:site-2 protease family protein [Oceanobacillus piezotolerans]RLL47966.1 stage IV sporulation protein FB [Oceanobacillus piezotolerans]
MTNRNRFPKVNVHPILLIFIIISILTGTFMELSIIILIVFIHELGHYLMAYLLKWRIRSIMLWVFGGVMETDEHGNRSIREEFLVTISGPFQHLIIYLFLFCFKYFHVIPDSIISVALYYNTLILCFNLLPIWPLDGGKLLYLLSSKFIPYKKAYYSIILFSIVTASLFLFIQFIFFPFTLSAFLIMIFLLFENKNEWKQRYYAFIRFLLNRYEGNHYVCKINPIQVGSGSTMMELFSMFKRDQKHPIYIIYPKEKRKVVDEMDCLHVYFSDNRHNETIGERFN